MHGRTTLPAAVAAPDLPGWARAGRDSFQGRRGSFEFTTGYVEAGIYIPGSCPGLIQNWPAWWTAAVKCTNSFLDGVTHWRQSSALRGFASSF